MKPKKIPQRRCIGCGERFDKMALIRIVRTPEGDIVLDRTGKRAGRGAYLCHSVTCLRRAKKANRLAQNLECEITEQIYLDLEAELQKDHV
jgi:predicted RNA-binding protein YlxR (DUF448 family)